VGDMRVFDNSAHHLRTHTQTHFGTFIEQLIYLRQQFLAHAHRDTKHGHGHGHTYANL